MIPRPDAEAAWIAWLAAGGFTASTRLPREQVDGMTRVSRVGGQRLNIVQDQPTMLFETWHRDGYQASQRAHDLAERVEAALDGTRLDASTRVSNVTTTGPIDFPDPSSPLVRYQFTATCLLRRVSA